MNRDISVCQIRSDQISRVRLFVTPWKAARQASLSITNSRSSLRLTSIESVMPSSHLILCRPLLLLPLIPPSISVYRIILTGLTHVLMKSEKRWIKKNDAEKMSEASPYLVRHIKLQTQWAAQTGHEIWQNTPSSSWSHQGRDFPANWNS